MTPDKIFEIGAKERLKSFKFQNQKFEEGDSAHIAVTRDRAQAHHLVKILEIYRVTQGPEKYCILKVQFFYQKPHLSQKLYGSFMKHISDYELFASDLEQLISATWILEKAMIYSLPEYNKRPGEICFFSQSSINKETGVVEPAIKDRPRVCVCHAIECPDYNYVLCDKCEKWLHYDCAGFTNSEGFQNRVFVCKICQKL